MLHIETWELLSYMVTVLGLPFAIFLFFFEQRKERENEEEEVHAILADSYTDFLKLAIANPDLRLRTRQATPDLSQEQQNRMMAMLEILVSIFERAYLLTFEPKMKGNKLRRWRSWEDFMRQWCRREDFRTHLPDLLVGEDPDFAAYLTALADEEAGADRHRGAKP